MKNNNYLVVFYTGNGVSSMVVNFKQYPPAVDELTALQNEAKEIMGMEQTPAIVNWLPVKGL